MRNGYIINILTSVDVPQIIKSGGKVTQVYEGVINRENFKISPFRTVKEKQFASRQKYKKERNVFMQGLVSL